jgi:uncharacterized protein (TIGR03067 family)
MQYTKLSAITVALLLAGGASLAGADDPPKAHDPNLEGEWVHVSFVVNGMKRPLEPDMKCVYYFKADTLTKTVKDHNQASEMQATFKLDASKKPKTIDIGYGSGLFVENAPADAEIPPALGIYEIKDSVLRICFAQPGKKRPTRFRAEVGSGLTLITAKRVKK